MNDLDASLLPVNEVAWEVRCDIQSGTTFSSAVLIALAREDVRARLTGWAFILPEQRKLSAWASKVGWNIHWSETEHNYDGMWKARIRKWEKL
jgi:hypothetical protein